MPAPAERPPEERLTHREYLARRYFPELDGLRAFFVLAVITAHVHGAPWGPLAGSQGVIGFFVLSGFLITTLCARETSGGGTLAVGAFLVRRAFRILPLYLVVLAGYVVLILVLGQEPDKREGFLFVLPYYVTFTNEIPLYWSHFRGAVPYFQTWSLGVEEKFYLVWPVVGYAVLRGVRHGRLVVLLVTIVALTWVQVGRHSTWAGWYLALAVGCLLALLLHDARAYSVLRRLARPAVAVAMVALLVLDHLLVGGHVRLGETLYPWLVAGLLVSLVLIDSPLARLARSRPARVVGVRSYAMYLVHLAGIAAVDRVVAPSASIGPQTVLGYVVVVLVTFAAADVLHRTIELPMIAVGRRRVAPRRVAVASA